MRQQQGPWTTVVSCWPACGSLRPCVRESCCESVSLHGLHMQVLRHAALAGRLDDCRKLLASMWDKDMTPIPEEHLSEVLLAAAAVR